MLGRGRGGGGMGGFIQQFKSFITQPKGKGNISKSCYGNRKRKHALGFGLKFKETSAQKQTQEKQPAN